MITGSKIEDTNSRTNPLESLESTPVSSRRQSLEGGSDSSSALPSRKELVRGVYEKMRVFLAEEIERLSRASQNEMKTPAKVDSGLGSVPICPPLKRLNRKVSTVVGESCDTLFLAKRPLPY